MAFAFWKSMSLESFLHRHGALSSQAATISNVALAAAASATAVAVSLVYLRRWRTQSKSLHRRRTWSFTSVGLMMGAFPERCHVPDPIINSALYFADCPSVEDIVEQVIRPLLQYERLSTVPDVTLQYSRHLSSPVDPYSLVRCIQVAGDTAVLNQAIFDHTQDALDDRPDLPWWEILLLQNSEGPSACVVRVHHALADGLSLVSVFEKILKHVDGTQVESLVTRALLKGAASRASSQTWFQKLYSIVEATIHVLTLGAGRYDDEIAFVCNPQNRKNRKAMVFSGSRTFITFPLIPLDFIKQLKNAAGGGVTVNDVIMTAFSFAIYNYSKQKSCPVLAAKQDKVQCRALLPVSFPRTIDELSDPTMALRNKWCMVSANMQVGRPTGSSNGADDDIVGRLLRIHSTTQEIKSKPRAFMQLTIQNTIPPLLPTSMARETVFDVFSRHSLVLTNVPGPEKACLFAGKEILSTQLFFNNILTQVNFLSYRGQIAGNMVFDPNTVDLIEGYGSENNSFSRDFVQALKDLAKKLDVTVPESLK